MNKLLEIKNLEVSYQTYAGEVQAVRGIDFSLSKGEAVAIVGESGCGKSVTAKAIMGLIESPSGVVKSKSQIIYNKKNILEFTEKEWREFRGAECSMIFQDALTSLNPTMTIGKQIAENLTTHMNISKTEALNKAEDLLRIVEIPDVQKRIKSYPHEFSGGMRQRVMIAIALACNPKILIADEPTTALDVTIQAQIIDILKNLKKNHTTAIVLITHDLGIVADIAERVVVMYSGKIVEQGNCREIFYNPKHPYTLNLLRSVPRLDFDKTQRLQTIEGAPPNLINPPEGCAFSLRCEHSMNICLKKQPPIFRFGDEHLASCWLHHENASNISAPFKTGGVIYDR